ncbi:flagellar hook-associated protein FlgK [Parvularcula sp. ZS-1/3]|uniref:Flagellar hook-associated protein 1 n=1 Tax=Parvularcula mediterranea TaxID=2732508 RepID=A0A7Y3RJS3_9PROT|nr:flagellar hook-associated protein FlgK [Parvularcula mediterranea]NNU15363.1 flagellar hook-associated protein FlgK [Parvularcula mediterranea]
MSFAATLSNSLSGLSMASLRAEVLSFNIANAGTVGFTRRSVLSEAVVPGGVRATGIERASAEVQERQLISSLGREAADLGRADALRAIFESFGEVGDADGLYPAIARFEEALSDLRLSPESGAAQQGLLRAAQDVTETFARIDTQIQDARLSADRQIASDVERLNAALSELDTLNQEARRPKGVELDAVAERQRALVLEIGAMLDINVTGSYGEAVTIRTGNGVLLLGEEPKTVDFTPSGSASFSLSFANGDFSGLKVDGFDVTPGGVQGIRGGSLAASFAVRDVLATDAANRIDALARQLTERSADADTTSTEGLFVLGAGTSSAAQLITVNLLGDPAQGGELYRLREGMGATAPGPEGGQGVLADLEAFLSEQRVLTTATGTASSLSFIDTVGAVSSRFGTDAFRAQNIAASSESATVTLESEINRLTAVDTDRELQDLLLVEQAFAANARVIQTADDMLAQLLEI